jgi:hypothetical protein
MIEFNACRGYCRYANIINKNMYYMLNEWSKLKKRSTLFFFLSDHHLMIPNVHLTGLCITVNNLLTVNSN